MTNEEHIEQLKKLRSFHNGSYGTSINKAIEALNQQKEGVWVFKQDHSVLDYWGHQECNQCGYKLSFPTTYCPNCGARMKEGERMRLIDADKLYPDRMTNKGNVAISQSQIAKAQTVEAIPLSVIDEIKAEIEHEYASCCICEINENYKFDEYGVSEYYEVDSINGVLEIIDAKVKEYQKVGG